MLAGPAVAIKAAELRVILSVARLERASSVVAGVVPARGQLVAQGARPAMPVQVQGVLVPVVVVRESTPPMRQPITAAPVEVVL